MTKQEQAVIDEMANIAINRGYTDDEFATQIVGLLIHDKGNLNKYQRTILTSLQIFRAWEIKRTPLRKMVFGNLDASKENGYFEPGQQLHGSSAKDIACDMIAYAADAEHINDATILVPFVQEWINLNMPPVHAAELD